VQYLAEIQKQKAGFNISGKSKAELKLLACQRTEQSWSAIPGEELVPAPDEANNFNHGVLVLVDMNTNRQIQSPLKDAGKYLVKILQDLSRQIEKYKKEADEIESWRQSLSLQSQQLQLRQEEIYAREEELESTRAELDRLSQEAQALESTIGEHDRQRQEIEAAWAEIRQQQQIIEQHQQVSGGGAAVSEQQIAEIRTALNQIGDGGAIDYQAIAATVASIQVQQDLLDRHWERLRQQKQTTTETEFQLQQQQQELTASQNDLQDLETSLDRAKTEWEVQQQVLTNQQEYAHRLQVRIELEQENYQSIYLMSKGGGSDLGDLKVDFEQLDAMPVEELDQIVASLQSEVDRAVNFVNLQEEELTEMQAVLAELQEQIQTANEFDKIKLEADLVDEKDAFQMLESTIQGQRETLSERQAYLKLHARILRQRQGHPPADADRSQIEWEAILALLQAQRQQQQTELNELNSQIENMRSTLEQSKAKVEQQVNEYITKAERVQKLEAQIAASRQNITEIAAKVELYQEMIQPLQDHVNTVREQLERLNAGGNGGSNGVRQHLDSLLDRLAHTG
jgi:chromosome segregation ATPase